MLKGRGPRSGEGIRYGLQTQFRIDGARERIAQKYDLTDAKAKDMIVKTDKKRASYYNYYTNKEWGDAKGYDLCLNSGKLGVYGTVKAILEYLKIRNGIENPKL